MGNDTSTIHHPYAKTFLELKANVAEANILAKECLGRQGTLRFKVSPEKESDFPVAFLWKRSVRVTAVSSKRKQKIKKTYKLNFRHFHFVLFQLRETKQQRHQTKEPSKELETSESPLRQSLEEEDFDSECPICMERKPNIALECAHAFCETCIDLWKQKTQTDSALDTSCPLCRADMKEDDLWVITSKNQSTDLISFFQDFMKQFQTTN